MAASWLLSVYFAQNLFALEFLEEGGREDLEQSQN